MLKLQVIIAIDPDVEKNGVAYLDCDTRKLELASLSFPDLLDYLFSLKRQAEITGKTYRVLIEAGWLNKSNWHVSPKDTKAVAAAKGNHTGRNQETGRKIVEMCEHWNIPHELVKPLSKCWKGSDKKITNEELAKFTGIQGRTNQEMRDAALISWIYAGFPVKIN